MEPVLRSVQLVAQYHEWTAVTGDNPKIHIHTVHGWGCDGMAKEAESNWRQGAGGYFVQRR